MPSTRSAPTPTPTSSSAPAAGLAIDAVGITKTYGDRTVLHGVDLQVEVGEIFAVLGPNGAGKTTLVEILEGYRDRDSGSATVLDVDPARAGLDWRGRIGIVLQGTGSFDELTVGEVVHHFAGYYVDPREPDELIAAVGLDHQRDTRTAKLSGGQLRRLDVALAILGRPELVFLDEPTTGFDPEARRQFWHLIRRLADDGCTVLLTTHYLDEAEALADRVAVIAEGRVVEVSTPRDLGGRASGDAVVRWTEGGRTRERRTSAPTEVVRELSERFSGEIPELAVLRPTLEDAYLDLIGAER